MGKHDNAWNRDVSTQTKNIKKCLLKNKSTQKEKSRRFLVDWWKNNLAIHKADSQIATLITT
jgi:uncharacterized protein YpuA (DUF1002 family)